MNQLILKAKQFSVKMHQHQVRNNSIDESVIVHLSEVAMLVADAHGSDIQIAAAWLHDIIEDTEVTLEDIKNNFGDEVAKIVFELTDPEDYKDLSLELRKAKQATRILNLSRETHLVKVCDQISNVRSIVFDPPKDWDKLTSFLYIEGANKIIKNCNVNSDYLMCLFDRYYQMGIKKYS
jgi:(p)ppGpp synthase/HD superfamily hydrolase